MNKPIDVVVAVPAHNERQLIRRCLESVKIAARHATQSGVAGRVLIAVAAHRCTDRTAEEALTCLAGYPGSFLVTVDRYSTTVGAVRAQLLNAVAERHALRSHRQPEHHRTRNQNTKPCNDFHDPSKAP